MLSGLALARTERLKGARSGTGIAVGLCHSFSFTFKRPSSTLISSTPSEKVFQKPLSVPNFSTRSIFFIPPSHAFGIGTPIIVMPLRMTTGLPLPYEKTIPDLRRRILPPIIGKSSSTGRINFALIRSSDKSIANFFAIKIGDVVY